MENNQDFVKWFRNSSAYINAHRNQTFVIYFGGEVLMEDFETLIHDFAVLKSLGIRLVLVYGIRPQIENQLQALNIPSLFEKNIRITNSKCLDIIKKIAGGIRVEIEALLSMGLLNSPIIDMSLKVASGNFVTAKPIGVIDGIDFGYSGQVRKIDSNAIAQLLKHDNIVLISPLGYSPTGEVFSLIAAEVAAEVACALQAKKLIFLTEDNYYTEQNLVLYQATTQEALNFLATKPKITSDQIKTLKAAIHSCQQGIERVHLINRHCDGALLLELFTRDGIGTLISSVAFEELRTATLADIGGILELIKPLEKQGKLVNRSKEKLEMRVRDYIIIERDGLIIACTALHKLNDTFTAIIACLAVHPDYQNEGRGQRLFDFLLKQAQQQGLKKIFVCSTQTTHWFIERGFKLLNIETLPIELKNDYNPSRNSKIMYKKLL